MALVMLVAFGGMANAEKYYRNETPLPVAARKVVKDNFKSSISLVKVEKKMGSVSEYEVILDDGAEITFDKKGNWKEVEVGKNRSVPAYFIPGAIAKHLSSYYKDAKVVGIEKDRKGYEVKLSNDIELKFRPDGSFLRYD